jgi:short-subunit dehydrogenase
MYKWFYFWKIKPVTKEYKPVVLITGCSSGIGLSTAQLLYQKTHFRVVVTAREKSLGVVRNLFQENENFWILPLDVADEDSRKKLVDEVLQRWGRVDVLVNNAGICYRSVLEEMQDKDELLQMSTNYLGPVSLIRLLLPSMRKNGVGKIINISSVSGMLAMPTMASYSASKFALEGAMEALWYEARPFGINVSLVQPGFVRSDSHTKVKYSVRSQLSSKLDRPYTDIYKEMVPFIERFMKWGLVTSEDVAELVYNVIKTENPPLWVPASLDAEFFYYLKRWFPRRLLMPFFYWTLPGSDKWGHRFTKKVSKTGIRVFLRNFFQKSRGYFGQVE